MEGGEIEEGERKMPKKKKEGFGELLIIIAGFVSFVFGLLVLLTPEEYPIGKLPTSYNPLIGIVLIVLGLYVLLGRD